MFGTHIAPASLYIDQWNTLGLIVKTCIYLVCGMGKNSAARERTHGCFNLIWMCMVLYGGLYICSILTMGERKVFNFLTFDDVYERFGCRSRGGVLERKRNMRIDQNTMGPFRWWIPYCYKLCDGAYGFGCVYMAQLYTIEGPWRRVITDWYFSNMNFYYFYSYIGCRRIRNENGEFHTKSVKNSR